MLEFRGLACACILLFVSQPVASQSLTAFKKFDATLGIPLDSQGPQAIQKYRVEELNRRAYEPVASSDDSTQMRLEYSAIVDGCEPLNALDLKRISTTAEMPSTSCKSVFEVRKDPSSATEGPWKAHQSTVHLFTSQSGFGFWRMAVYSNARGKRMGAPGIDRVELVSLMTSEEPTIYILDEIAKPSLARHARRRQLDEFEQRGLDAVRRGSDLVSTQEAPRRMFGAIRADKSCLECHARAKENDLLGAFSYYLETSFDKLEQVPRGW